MQERQSLRAKDLLRHTGLFFVSFILSYSLAASPYSVASAAEIPLSSRGPQGASGEFISPSMIESITGDSHIASLISQVITQFVPALSVPYQVSNPSYDHLEMNTSVPIDVGGFDGNDVEAAAVESASSFSDAAARIADIQTRLYLLLGRHVDDSLADATGNLSSAIENAYVIGQAVALSETESVRAAATNADTQLAQAVTGFEDYEAAYRLSQQGALSKSSESPINQPLSAATTTPIRTSLADAIATTSSLRKNMAMSASAAASIQPPVAYHANTAPAPTTTNSAELVTETSLADQLAALKNDLEGELRDSLATVSDRSSSSDQAPYEPLSSPAGTAGGFGNAFSLASRINALSGVTITNATITNSSGVGTAGPTALSGLSDVSLVSPALGHLFEYNGSAWTNVSTSSLGITGIWTTGTGSSVSYSTGNVGIGTTTPGSVLSVVGTTTSSNLAIAGSSNGSGVLVLGGLNGSSIFNQEISQGISGNNSTLLFNLNHGSLPGSNETNTVRFNGPNTTIDAVNANDSLGIKFGESFNTGYVGLVNTGGGSNGSVPGGGFLLTMGFSNAGKVGSIIPTTSFGSPTWRNVLDDGSGNMTVTGNIGIGTTTPGSILAINGVANFTTATSTFYSTGGIDLAGGCFSVNGACIGSASAPNLYASTTIGTGAQAGGLTIAGGATTTGNAYVGGKVGIGTVMPSYSLDIFKSSQPQIHIGNTSSLLGAWFGSNANDELFLAGGASDENSGWTARTATPSLIDMISGAISFETDNGQAPGSVYTPSQRMVITNTGLVGIGTSTPGSLLSLGGIANLTTATSTLYSSGGFNMLHGCYAVNGTCLSTGGASSQWTTSGSNIFYSSGNIGVGTTTPFANFTIAQTSSNTAPLSIYNYQKGGSFTVVTLTYTASSTWTKPANLDHIVVALYGGGGGSAGTSGTGGNGGSSTFTYNSGGNTITAGGGGGASSATGGSAGIASGGDTNTNGNAGSAPSTGGNGGTAAGPLGGAGGTGVTSNTATNGGNAPGGGGGGLNENSSGGAGGGGGAYAAKTLSAAQLGSSEIIQVGGGGGGGLSSGGGSGNSSGAGGGGSGGGAGNGTSATNGSTTGGGGASLYNGSSAVGGSGGTAGNAGGAGQNATNQPGGGGGGGSGVTASLSADGVNYTYSAGGAGGAGGTCTGSGFCYAASGGGGGGGAAGGSGGAGNTTNVQGMAGGAGGEVIITEYISNNTIVSSTPTLTVSSGGNVGIGTTSPYANLSVWGGTSGDIADFISSASTTLFSVTSNGFGTTTLAGLAVNGQATSTSNVGFNITSGCYAINGTCIGAGGGVGLGANTWTGLQTFGVGFISNASSTVNGNFTSTGFVSAANGYQQSGSMVLYASTTNSSVAVGIGAGTIFNTTSGVNNNTAVGYTALYSSSLSGSSNSAFGSGALYGNTSGYSNSAFGASAFNKLTTGTLNTGFGSGVGYANISGTGNSYFGYNSGQNATTSSYNTGVGYEALYGNSASGGIGNTYNTALGYQAGFDLTTGADNTFLGQFPTTGMGITSGSNNILIGQDVRTGLLQTGSNQLNIGNLLFATGLGSGGTLSSGNIGIGTSTPFAKLHIVGGSSGNILELDSTASAASTTMSTFSNAGLFSIGDDIGYSSGIFSVDASSSTTTISNLSVGNIVFDTDAGVVNLSDLPIDSNAAQGTLESQSINIGGNPLITAYGVSNGSGGLQNLGVGIGTSTTPYAMLQVWGVDTSGSSPAFLIANSASTTEFTVYDNGSATLAGALTQNSDQRLKTNVVSLDASSSLGLIDSLRPVDYNWIDPAQGTSTQIGFIAQEVQRIFPTLVATTSPTALTPDGTLSVNYIGFIAPIVSAIQELSAQVASLETAIGNLASLVTTHEVDTQKLCVGQVCVTQAQFLAMVQAANQQSSSPASSGSSSDSSSGSSSAPTAPTISISGNNPATVDLNTTYSDLGATITGPSADLNLGISASVDGGATTTLSAITIDTSAVGTHTITYSVTDQNGLTGTATRMVNVVAPQ